MLSVYRGELFVFELHFTLDFQFEQGYFIPYALNLVLQPLYPV